MLNVSSANIIEGIEEFARVNGVDYLDACLTYCEKNNVDPDYLASVIKRDPAFKAKMQAEAEDLNVLKKTARLPI
jgi:hypothetical protein